MSAHKPSLLVIVGPTAVGKTAVALRIAQRFSGEIISADSMQIYRLMDIGTAKPGREELEDVPHHLVDFIDPGQDFSVQEFQRLAQDLIKDIANRGRLPMLVGGTGLYINAVIDDYQFAETEPDTAIRDHLMGLAEEKGPEALHDRLARVDPVTAAKTHPNNVRRVVRALEVYRTSGTPISEAALETEKTEPQYDCLVIGLTTDRAQLYQRIDKRVDKMIDAGLEDEVRMLLARGYSADGQALQALGYKEFVDYLQGRVGLEETIALIKRGTRRFAKRQLTWFRRDERTLWFDVGQGLDQVVKDISTVVAGKWK